MEAIDNYVKEIQEAQIKDWNRHGFTLPHPIISMTKGQKFYKIYITTFGSKAIHCFVDFDGNIFKAASLNAPAKGIRGNINNEKKPLLCGDFYRYR
jgi:hypothetical protein